MTLRINLNADLGESYGAWDMGRDVEILSTVTSANIACGFHAGDPLVMRRTLQHARQAGVGVGAHPSFPDLQGFGRRNMQIPAPELEAIIIYQLAALAGMAQAEGLRMEHVKPHGALNNMACADPILAATVARAVRDFDPALILLAPACSHLGAAGRAAGLRVVDEIFADRAYQDDGQLVPRSRPDAMIHGAANAADRLLRFLDTGLMPVIGGDPIPLAAQSICVHGDSPGAVRIARRIRALFDAEGVTLAPFARA